MAWLQGRASPQTDRQTDTRARQGKGAGMAWQSMAGLSYRYDAGRQPQTATDKPTRRRERVERRARARAQIALPGRRDGKARA